jgi:hypothetical protein
MLKFSDQKTIQPDAIYNINKLLKTLKIKLKNNDCDIYTIDELIIFLNIILSMFNETPHFTIFSWGDTVIIEQFHDVLTQGALYLVLGAQSLIKHGKEFRINNETSFIISELLNSEYQTEITNWYDKCKLIKNI